MPLTEKGKEIKSSMTEQYGPEKGEEVFYASKNAGRISGVDTKADQQAQPQAAQPKPQPQAAQPQAQGQGQQQAQQPPVKETKTTVKEPAGGAEGEQKQDPKATLKAAEDELDALEREQEQSEEGLGRQNAIEDQKKIIRTLRNEMRETEHKERMGVADAVEKLEYLQDSTLLMKHIGDACDKLADRMDAFQAKSERA
jgi:hypothetical protein